MSLIARLTQNRNPKGLLIAACVSVALLACVVWLIWMSPVRLRAGQIVDEFGTYRSPQGHYRITFSTTPDGNVRWTLAGRTTRFWILTRYGTGESHDFDAEREWFACFDEYERLWLFVGKWDSQWGEVRRRASGGSPSRVPAVWLHGFTFKSSRVVPVLCIVRDGDHWSGVPPEFFDRIPEKGQPVWGTSTVIPDSAPLLTATERQAAESFLTQTSALRRVF